MATYTPENSATAIRINGPAGPVRAMSDNTITFKRVPGSRQWVGAHGKTYDNFGSVLCEWIRLEDAPDPYEEAVKWFSGVSNLCTADLLTNSAKKHAVEIIKKAIEPTSKAKSHAW